MRSNSTQKNLLLATAALVVLGLGGLVALPDRVASPMPTTRQPQGEGAPRAATNDAAQPDNGSEHAGAAMATTEPAPADGHRRTAFVLLVDDDFLGAFDDRFEATFERQHQEFDLQLRPAPAGDAARALRAGAADAAVVGGEPAARGIGAGLPSVWLGCEVFAMAVPSASPLQSLSGWQLRGLLTGEVRDWSALGGAPAPVTVVLPCAQGIPERAGRRLLGRSIALGDAISVDEDTKVLDLVRPSELCIGLVRVGVADDPGSRLLPVDGIAPTRDNVRFGVYPFGTQAYLVSAGTISGGSELLLRFLRSDAGRALLARQLSTPQ